MILRQPRADRRGWHLDADDTSGDPPFYGLPFVDPLGIPMMRYENKEANWLPAPPDEFNVVLQLYWPRSPILTGEWTPPPLRSSADLGNTILPK